MNREQNFDNFPNALRTVIEIASTEGWVRIMYHSIDGTSIDMQPITSHSPSRFWLFVVFMVVGSFFMLNLFVGVVTDTFNRLKKENNGNSILLTPEQRMWLKLQKMMMSEAPSDRCEMPQGDGAYGALQRQCFVWTYEHNSKSQLFSGAMIGCICANCAVPLSQLLLLLLLLVLLLTTTNY